MPMFEVRFTTREEGINAVAWEPKAGDGFLCFEAEARRRWDHLMAKGRKNRKVDGVVPYLVEVVDENGTVLLTCTTEKGDTPSGPWALAEAA
jgi:hypothetical protein